MNWEALGAIAELLGAMAVVGTLAYLARQIGTAKAEIATQTSLDLSFRVSELSKLTINNTALATAFSKLELGEELSPTEQIQVRAYANVCLTTWSEWHKQAVQFSNSDSLELLNVAASAFFRQPGSAEHWENVKAGYQAEFRTFMDKVLSMMRSQRST